MNLASSRALVAAAQALTTLPGLSSYSVVSAVIPAPGEFDKMFLKAAVGQPKITLSLIDPLVPQSEVEERSVSPSDQVYDLFGLTSFARCVSALIYIFESDRSLARLNTWVLPHLILLAILAEDQRVQPESSATAFSPSTSEETLAELAQSAVRIATSILSSLAGELPNGWHANTVSALQKGQAPQDSNDLAAVLAKVYAQALEHDLADVARTFSKLLSGVLNFSSAEASDGERWLKLGQSIQDKGESQCNAAWVCSTIVEFLPRVGYLSATIVAQAITYDVKGLVLETPTYDRYRNELAARLAGVPPSKANTSGLPLLRLLIAAAPPSDSTIVFLPQQRAIFLLQALQKWVASDEDLDEEINTRLVEIFVHLAPIVQEITGSHTDFFFDLVESNLEVSDIAMLLEAPFLIIDSARSCTRLPPCRMTPHFRRFTTRCGCSKCCATWHFATRRCARYGATARPLRSSWCTIYSSRKLVSF